MSRGDSFSFSQENSSAGNNNNYQLETMKPRLYGTRRSQSENSRSSKTNLRNYPRARSYGPEHSDQLDDPCVCGPNLFGKVLGPTVDEPLLLGLQTFLKMCNDCPERDYNQEDLLSKSSKGRRAGVSGSSTGDHNLVESSTSSNYTHPDSDGGKSNSYSVSTGTENSPVSTLNSASTGTGNSRSTKSSKESSNLQDTTSNSKSGNTKSSSISKESSNITAVQRFENEEESLTNDIKSYDPNNDVKLKMKSISTEVKSNSTDSSTLTEKSVSFSGTRTKADDLSTLKTTSGILSVIKSVDTEEGSDSSVPMPPCLAMSAAVISSTPKTKSNHTDTSINGIDEISPRILSDSTQTSVERDETLINTHEYDQEVSSKETQQKSDVGQHSTFYDHSYDTAFKRGPLSHSTPQRSQHHQYGTKDHETMSHEVHGNSDGQHSTFYDQSYDTTFKRGPLIHSTPQRSQHHQHGTKDHETMPHEVHANSVQHNLSHHGTSYHKSANQGPKQHDSTYQTTHNGASHHGTKDHETMPHETHANSTQHNLTHHGSTSIHHDSTYHSTHDGASYHGTKNHKTMPHDIHGNSTQHNLSHHESSYHNSPNQGQHHATHQSTQHKPFDYGSMEHDAFPVSHKSTEVQGNRESFLQGHVFHPTISRQRIDECSQTISCTCCNCNTDRFTHHCRDALTLSGFTQTDHKNPHHTNHHISNHNVQNHNGSHHSKHGHNSSHHKADHKKHSPSHHESHHSPLSHASPDSTHLTHKGDHHKSRCKCKKGSKCFCCSCDSRESMHSKSHHKELDKISDHHHSNSVHHHENKHNYSNHHNRDHHYKEDHPSTHHLSNKRSDIYHHSSDASGSFREPHRAGHHHESIHHDADGHHSSEHLSYHNRDNHKHNLSSHHTGHHENSYRHKEDHPLGHHLSHKRSDIYDVDGHHSTEHASHHDREHHKPHHSHQSSSHGHLSQCSHHSGSFRESNHKPHKSGHHLSHHETSSHHLPKKEHNTQEVNKHCECCMCKEIYNEMVAEHKKKKKNAKLAHQFPPHNTSSHQAYDSGTPRHETWSPEAASKQSVLNHENVHQEIHQSAHHLHPTKHTEIKSHFHGISNPTGPGSEVHSSEHHPAYHSKTGCITRKYLFDQGFSAAQQGGYAHRNVKINNEVQELPYDSTNMNNSPDSQRSNLQSICPKSCTCNACIDAEIERLRSLKISQSCPCSNKIKNKSCECNPESLITFCSKSAFTLDSPIAPLKTGSVKLSKCSKGNCANPEIRYAITKISKYGDFTTFELMKSTTKKPKICPCPIEGVFVLKNKKT